MEQKPIGVIIVTVASHVNLGQRLWGRSEKHWAEQPRCFSFYVTSYTCWKIFEALFQIQLLGTTQTDSSHMHMVEEERHIKHFLDQHQTLHRISSESSTVSLWSVYFLTHCSSETLRSKELINCRLFPLVKLKLWLLSLNPVFSWTCLFYFVRLISVQLPNKLDHPQRLCYFTDSYLWRWERKHTGF